MGDFSLGVIPTRFMSNKFNNDIDGTVMIAVSFVFLAYFLDPFVERAFYRVRAWRAWRAIERHETVEVTNYATMDELFRGRRKWDAARIIAATLVVFSITSGILELSLDLSNVDATDVDALDRPPPVVRDGNAWKYVVLGQLGQVKTLQEVERGGVRKNDDWSERYQKGNTKSRYKVGDDRVLYEGTILTSWWDKNVSNAPSPLAYNTDDSGSTLLSSLYCDDSGGGEVHTSDETWGGYLPCSTGPQVDEDTTQPPVIKLTKSNGATYLVVEENSNYPNFLYSVWKNTPKTADNSASVTATTSTADENKIIEHLFHIASNSRVVETIITGVVNDRETGGGCMELLWIYSDSNAEYGFDDRNRAKPFGEHPTGSIIKTFNLRNIEPIEDGVDLDLRASICALLLLLMTVVGAAWSFHLRSRVGMDVYDRDTLIKAVTLPEQGAEDAPPSAMRMFVKKEETSNRINVIISEHGEASGWLSGMTFLCCKQTVTASSEPVLPSIAHRGTDARGSPSTRQVQLEGLRVGMQRPWGPEGVTGCGPRRVCLSASPVSSAASSPTNVRTPNDPDPEAIARMNMARALLESESVSAALGSSSRTDNFDDSYSTQPSSTMRDSGRIRDISRYGSGSRQVEGGGISYLGLRGSNRNSALRPTVNISIASGHTLPSHRGRSVGLEITAISSTRGGEVLSPISSTPVAQTASGFASPSSDTVGLDTTVPDAPVTAPDARPPPAGDEAAAGGGDAMLPSSESPTMASSPLPARQLVGGIDTMGPAVFHSLRDPQSPPHNEAPGTRATPNGEMLHRSE